MTGSSFVKHNYNLIELKLYVFICDVKNFEILERISFYQF